MSDSAESIKKVSIQNGLILAIFALVSTGLIAITHLITKDKIAEEIEAAMARRLNEIIPADAYNNDVYHDCTVISSPEFLGTPENLKAYRMRNNEKDYAVFMTSVAPDGYAGKINLVIGIYENGTIAGVRVTEHQETPGLGDKIEIEKSDWIKQFNDKSLTNTAKENWLVKKDGGEFDAFTGATITPRAIVKSVYNSLLFHQQNRDTLYAKGSGCGGEK
ncbi:electron transport complex subunit RsxG [Aliikangiella coralliicola]|uniref:Ion-translocating oxidoreductase complex subunit G n=2 Tax=Aliikangiella coralliicola TaxID=2592383 RepID=A0A545UDV1_9GAMM|nr:electron transport complex subunit RsxG [Aliikangiella coralliicola]